MKRIIRLTESDLTRIVRRVIKEAEVSDDKTGLAKTIVGKLMTASGGMGTDESAMNEAVFMIKDKPTYLAVIKVLQTSPNVKSQFGKNFNKVIDLVATEISSRGDYKDPYHTSDTKWFVNIRDYLTRFNDSEKTTSGDGGRNREWES